MSSLGWGVVISEWLPLATATLLGCVHALEVDHMVAVSSFLAERPGLRSALGFGTRWGVGHGLAVFIVGGVLLATGLRWPERYDAWGEFLVGAMLIGIGVWAVARARKLHVHRPEEHGDHLHVHSHRAGERPHQHLHSHSHLKRVTRRHRHGPGLALVGAAHGLAGTSSAIALVPVTLIDRWWTGLAYLAAFGAGVTAGMVAFALLASAAFRHHRTGTVAYGRRAGVAVGLVAAGVGVWWVARALGPPGG